MIIGAQKTRGNLAAASILFTSSSFAGRRFFCRLILLPLLKAPSSSHFCTLRLLGNKRRDISYSFRALFWQPWRFRNIKRSGRCCCWYWLILWSSHRDIWDRVTSRNQPIGSSGAIWRERKPTGIRIFNIILVESAKNFHYS